VKFGLTMLSFVLAAAMLHASAAASGGPSDAVMQPVNALLAAANADDAAAMDRYVTGDAIVVDDFAPYRWTGPHAARQWWTDIDALFAKVGITQVHATASPVTQYSVSPDEAYVVVPLSVSYLLKGKAAGNTGLWTCVVHRYGASWKVAVAAWGTLTRTN
jgi:ketosteroid isomerase-like protein